jgi:hypothetical protein
MGQLDREDGFVRGTARILGSKSANLPTSIDEIIWLHEGVNQYDVKHGWIDLGVSSRDVTITRDIYDEYSLDSHMTVRPMMRVKIQLDNFFEFGRESSPDKFPTIAVLMRDAISNSISAFVFLRCMRMLMEVPLDFRIMGEASAFPLEFNFQDGVRLYSQRAEKTYAQQVSFSNFDEWVVSLVKQT